MHPDILLMDFIWKKKSFHFHFHIHSILPNISHVEIDTIRQSFMKQQQSIDCAINYFDNSHSQCQIYSFPFKGPCLDFISNRFPLFDTNETCK
ncbi:hypothetical protein I4U23_024181 [Adineta vaga]|nr:hypothetical protein I4U23_024181 [Adineta vaga]